MLQKKQTKADMSTYLLVDCFQFFFFFCMTCKITLYQTEGKAIKYIMVQKVCFSLAPRLQELTPNFLKEEKICLQKLEIKSETDSLGDLQPQVNNHHMDGSINHELLLLPTKMKKISQ